ncbi:ABC transporter ATP-binding protein [Ramlibacter sp.]|uniref:ABC transporter ATP-binding protein n=1 Tax=Ramlibacter sp. TaxID=1917967 RepID=UPI002C103C53|nr:ABC transporter ATP-binding protein [Ramlibacter sp.]HWI82985.1 ABC transporter ATP-binding protein [Ramlibacter sp.]
MSEAAPLLEMRDVTAGYAQDIDVLRDIRLRVDAGRITGLIGLNGAGKSTLVKTICGFLPPKAGMVRFAGQDISGIAPHRLIDLGICCIPQESSLFPYLSVQDNLLLPLLGRPRQFAGHMKARLQEVYDQFPALHEKRGQPAGSLSGGQQKQVEFAKAWLQQPRLCLIDEPSIGLSPKISEEVFVWIERFAKAQMGILLIDHNVRRVVRMSDRICVLSLGRITADGTPADFAGNLHQQVQQWLGLNF